MNSYKEREEVTFPGRYVAWETEWTDGFGLLGENAGNRVNQRLSVPWGETTHSRFS